MLVQGSLKTGAGRLTPSGAMQVIFLRNHGKTYQEIALELDVSVGTVRNVLKAESWSWLRSEYATLAVMR